jgi:hypothetical protein
VIKGPTLLFAYFMKKSEISVNIQTNLSANLVADVFDCIEFVDSDAFYIASHKAYINHDTFAFVWAFLLFEVV